jgi:hypothetical protein
VRRGCSDVAWIGWLQVKLKLRREGVGNRIAILSWWWLSRLHSRTGITPHEHRLGFDVSDENWHIIRGNLQDSMESMIRRCCEIFLEATLVANYRQLTPIAVDQTLPGDVQGIRLLEQ